jgi:hypothetical protein
VTRDRDHGPPEPARAAGPPTRRLHVDPDHAEQGLARLVLTVVELLRQLMERQALRRVEAGDLTDEQVERLGRALMQLEDTFDELIEHFGVTPNDVYLPLDLAGLVSAHGPITPLNDRPTRRTP